MDSVLPSLLHRLSSEDDMRSSMTSPRFVDRSFHAVIQLKEQMPYSAVSAASCRRRGGLSSIVNTRRRKIAREGTVQFKSLVLVHGAGSGPWIFSSWRDCFGPIDLRAVDLLADIDVDNASMADYAEAVERAAHEVPGPRACCGWSMGGLVAMMAHKHFDALILIEPSPPPSFRVTTVKH